MDEYLQYDRNPRAHIAEALNATCLSARNGWPIWASLLAAIGTVVAAIGDASWSLLGALGGVAVSAGLFSMWRVTMVVFRHDQDLSSPYSTGV